MSHAEPMKISQNYQTESALFGGPVTAPENPGDRFTWPIVTQEDEDAVLGVLRPGAMSGTDVTRQFEQEFASWQGSLPVTEAANARSYYIPWFKHYHREIIEQHAQAFRKVAQNYEKLLEGDSHQVVAARAGCPSVDSR